jgi:hypothetical protein
VSVTPQLSTSPFIRTLGAFVLLLLGFAGEGWALTFEEIEQRQRRSPVFEGDWECHSTTSVMHRDSSGVASDRITSTTLAFSNARGLLSVDEKSFNETARTVWKRSFVDSPERRIESIESQLAIIIDKRSSPILRPQSMSTTAGPIRDSDCWKARWVSATLTALN